MSACIIGMKHSQSLFENVLVKLNNWIRHIHFCGFHQNILNFQTRAKVDANRILTKSPRREHITPVKKTYIGIKFRIESHIKY